MLQSDSVVFWQAGTAGAIVPRRGGNCACQDVVSNADKAAVGH